MLTGGRAWCRAIAQGSSEYNVTILVDAKESVRALRAVHARFYLATLPLALAIVWPGLIGATFLGQLEQQMEARPPPPPPSHPPSSRGVAYIQVSAVLRFVTCA